MLRSVCVCLLVACCIPVLQSKRELPSFLKVCHRNDPHISQCIRSSIEMLKPYLGKGIPKMRVPALDPLRITSFDISQNYIRLIYKNYDLEKMNDFVLEDFDFDVDKCYLSAKIYYPQVVTRGNYVMNGRLLLLQLEGDGNFFLNITSLRLSWKMDCKKAMRGNKEYLEFTDIDTNLELDDFRIDMTNLFKDNPELTKNTVTIFNENSKSLVDEFKAPINKAIGEVVLRTIREIFNYFPFDILLPP